MMSILPTAIGVPTASGSTHSTADNTHQLQGLCVRHNPPTDHSPLHARHSVLGQQDAWHTGLPSTGHAAHDHTQYKRDTPAQAQCLLHSSLRLIPSTLHASLCTSSCTQPKATKSCPRNPTPSPSPTPTHAPQQETRTDKGTTCASTTGTSNKPQEPPTATETDSRGCKYGYNSSTAALLNPPLLPGEATGSLVARLWKLQRLPHKERGDEPSEDKCALTNTAACA